MSTKPAPATTNEENVLAESMGYTCHLDEKRGGNCCYFTKRDWTIWYTGRQGWACAITIDGHYHRHVYFDDLKRALERFKNI